MPATPNLDHLSITFPTDQVTFGQMRRFEPLDFAPDSFNRLKGCAAFAAHSWELKAAQKAVAAASGSPDPHPDIDRKTIVEALNDAYKSYGISSGIHQTRQLVRSLEEAAAQQVPGSKRAR